MDSRTLATQSKVVTCSLRATAIMSSDECMNDMMHMHFGGYIYIHQDIACSDHQNCWYFMLIS